MEWINVIISGAIGMIGALGGGSIIYWRETRKSKAAEAQKNTTEARLAEADFSEKILEKFQRIVLDRMDSGDAVRKQEFNALSLKIDKRFDVIEAEDRKQNETLRDVVEYLNGGFQKFEQNKQRKAKKTENEKSVKQNK